jgi:ribosome biogenesis GTPase
MPEGWIVRALSGYYDVSPGLQMTETVRCRARGIFKKKGITPLVGDRVVYGVTSTGEGTVDEIFPRTSELVRPPIANVELAVLVMSVAEPAPGWQLLDKLLVHTERAGIASIICLTKCDLSPGETDRAAADVREMASVYESMGYPVLMTSAKHGDGIELLRERLAGKISVFAGQSGVGKSSLLNALVPHLNLATGQISEKLGRGRHTTRHVELIPLGNGGVVADSPGFSQLDFAGMEKEELGRYFADFRAYAPECKFTGCLHRREPGCRVVAALEEGRIARSRYEHYLQFLEELTDRKRRY